MPTEVTELPRVFLNSVHLKGFKSIDDLTIDFQKGLNILIGKNGSGKSNFMEFLYEASKTYPFHNILYTYAQLSFTSNDKHTFIVEFERTIDKFNVKADNFDYEVKAKSKYTVDDEIIISDINNTGVVFIFNNKKINFSPLSSSLNTFFRQLGYFSVYVSYLKFNLPDNLDCINKSGHLKILKESKHSAVDQISTLRIIRRAVINLVTYLEFQKELIEKTTIIDFLKIEGNSLENLKRFSPIKDVRFNHNINIYEDQKSLLIENIQLEFQINNNWLPWSQLSDGTKRLFYIIAEVLYNDGLILIEEPELGIHPHQFNLLMDFLKEQAEHKQIIISTHSPKALDILNPDELGNILITYYDQQTGTQIRHLDEGEINKAKTYIKEVGFFSDYWLLSDLEG